MELKRKGAIRDVQTSPALIASLINGDINAFKEIYHTYFKKVFHFIRRFLLSKEDAEEITQDVFLKLWEKKSALDISKNVNSYLFAIAQHKIIDKYRQYVATESRIKKIISFRNKSIDINSTEQLMDFYELSGIINQLVDELPYGRRTIFKLNREEGYTYKDIAKLLRISEGTVEKQMSKALKTLRAKLNLKYGVYIDF